jgi:hypothetical protein
MVTVSLATRSSIPLDIGRIMSAMHAPERLGLGVERLRKQ